MAEIEIKLDSVQEFKLYGGIVYKFYQDTLKKVSIKGGENVISFIDVDSDNYITSIHNKNSCNFLRDYDDKIIVEIHYPHYKTIYGEPTEPMTFVDTLVGDFTNIILRNGGESLSLNAKMNHLVLNVSFGTGSINVNGKVNLLSLTTHNLGRINALGIESKEINIYQASNADMLVNFKNSKVKVRFHGNGDVKYTGIPNELNISGEGDGEVISY